MFKKVLAIIVTHNRKDLLNECIDSLLGQNYSCDILIVDNNSPDRIDRYKYIYRNDVYTFKKEGLRGILFLFARFIYHIFKIVFSGNNIAHKLSIMIKGHIGGINFNPSIEYVKKD